MKTKNLIILIIILTGIVSTTMAQGGPCRNDNKIREELQLTAKQVALWENIRTGFCNNVIELKQKDYLNSNDFQSQVTELRNIKRNEFRQILTPEQQKKFDSITESGPHFRLKGRKRHEMIHKTNLEAFSALTKKRAEFDSQLNDDEKQILEDFRIKRKERKTKRFINGECRKERTPEHRNKWLDRKIEIQPVMAIAELHKEELMELLKGTEPFFKPDISGKRHRNRRLPEKNCFRGKNSDRKMIFFLMMDPDEDIEEITQPNAVKIYPNPSSDNINIEFEIDQTSEVTIDLLNKYGSTIENISKEEYGPGKHTIEYNVELLPGRELYLVRISWPDAAVVEKFLKTR
ncbi:MAG: hypothetical protein K8R53_00025 [Bacteroidales bacterium]|nr:hypothetical protein [Bacteroidales bacterium]